MWQAKWAQVKMKGSYHSLSHGCLYIYKKKKPKQNENNEVLYKRW